MGLYHWSILHIRVGRRTYIRPLGGDGDGDGDRDTVQPWLLLSGQTWT